MVSFNFHNDPMKKVGSLLFSFTDQKVEAQKDYLSFLYHIASDVRQRQKLK